MLIDSRLKPELCCRKPAKAAKPGDPVKHEVTEHVFILRELPGVTPKEVGDGEQPGVAFATDGRMAVAVPVTLGSRALPEDGQGSFIDLEDVPGPIIPDALAHARKNLVAMKTASLELGDEAVSPDFSAFPRRMPGVPFEDTAKFDPLNVVANLGPTEATEMITFCPYRLLAIAKAMGIKEGYGVTLLLRGTDKPMSVIPLAPEACFQGEAVGILAPMKPNPMDEEGDGDGDGDDGDKGEAAK